MLVVADITLTYTIHEEKKMANEKACYRRLQVYKYQLVEDYAVQIELKSKNVATPYIALTPEGLLTIKKSYAWDGPSGPTFDTRNFMRGSLVHDALYQLMREKFLDYKSDREFADDLIRQHCLEDGMSGIRAWYVHKGLRWFGEKFARPPAADKPEEIICIP